MRKRLILLLLLGFAVSVGAFADTAAQKPYIDFGNTAWLIVATAFVLMMTIPGLAFFYGGLVRRKNVLSVVMQTFVITAVVSLQWVIIGYSLSFSSSHGVLAPFIGGFKWAFLNGIGVNDVSPYAISQSAARVPHLVFVMFQCMFAVITPALILGAFAERIKFSGFVLFTLLWTTLVYDPVAHWVWSSDGWLAKLGALDFAGGTVVHMNSGVAALVTALLIGKRRMHTDEGTAPPHNVPFVALGAALLWVGWFGFNAGSGVAADGLAASALLATHIATCAALLTWMVMDIIFNGKATVVGAATGAVAGLVAITPASGFVNVFGAIVIGIVVSVICFLAVAFMKPKFGYDDALDAFGVHGIGGMWGSLGTGLFAIAAVGGASGVFYGNGHQILPQLADIGATLLWSGVGTLITFKVADWLVGVRVTDRQEDIGLDLSQHNEKAYTVIE